MKTAKELLNTPALGETHQVTNVASELHSYNLFTTDAALVEGIQREGGAWGIAEVREFGALCGQPEYLELGHLANKYTPELDTHDRFGNRVDLVRYHAAYHTLMRTALENGLHSQPWTDPKPGAHVVRGAKAFLQSQVEAGHGCPVTMTFASIPSIRTQPEVAALFEQKILARGYDPRNLPVDHKTAITVGMGMTEKQGGSDVRANSTQATPVAEAGPGKLYSLVGHKWFLSAPMCDVFLILAQTAAGVSCFAVPRWLPDGSKNALNVIRLKDKMGNKSNASSEVEFRGAQGWLVGEEGRGVPTIIEMVSLTRFDCMGASAGLMRAGLANAIHHTRHRAAFGAKLLDQPLMQNVLADLALEYEGAMAFSMRMARALDHKDSHEHEAKLARLATAVGKYWICKRAPQHAYEIMECIGGSGVMENAIYPRLFRESVINPIWEGSGNVQCLDVLRAVGKDPAVLMAFVEELNLARGGNSILDGALNGLQAQLMSLTKATPHDLQFMARHLVDQMAVAFEASLLVRHAPAAVSEAFCSSRLASVGHHNYGTLPKGSAVQHIIERADPALDKV
ncbi:acyl-CoA dehydrogenase family protein [Limnobacter humi]|uniref:Acyl-CoA dehydrogenase family protein n=1 Tax=Limnobacter humi TaxID=1778671 RepID=A0ABT1WFL4_9BURK|nr:acyl-CoA dehydrogenase family protein [Limnobacter humi]MCQ8896307.1 acyl-CoA dehydrogenase family protein [Limnobacter humi]